MDRRETLTVGRTYSSAVPALL